MENNLQKMKLTTARRDTRKTFFSMLRQKELFRESTELDIHADNELYLDLPLHYVTHNDD